MHHDNHDDYLFTPAVRKLELAAIVQILADIRDFMGVPPQVWFSIEGYGLKTTGRNISMELREGQQVDLSVTLKTASGNPAAYEKGTAKWTSSDDTVVAVEPNADSELNAIARSINGANNTPVVITFTCDGDPDAGPDQVRNIVATLDVVATQGEAMVAEIQAGPPQPIPMQAGTPKKK